MEYPLKESPTFPSFLSANQTRIAINRSLFGLLKSKFHNFMPSDIWPCCCVGTKFANPKIAPTATKSCPHGPNKDSFCTMKNTIRNAEDKFANGPPSTKIKYFQFKPDRLAGEIFADPLNMLCHAQCQLTLCARSISNGPIRMWLNRSPTRSPA